MQNGSFPHSSVWSILIKAELEESEPPRKQKDFHLAVQWRGPSSTRDRRSMASEANVPITWILFIIYQICSILKVHPWKTGKDGRMQTMSCLRGGGGALLHVFRSDCFHLLVTFRVERWEAAADPEGGVRDGITAEQYQLQRKREVNKGNRGWFPLDTIYFSHHKGGNGLYFTPETWCLVSLVVGVEKTVSVFLLHQMCSVYCDDVEIKIPTSSGDSKWFMFWKGTLFLRDDPRMQKSGSRMHLQPSSECRRVIFVMHGSKIWAHQIAALPEAKQPRLSSEQLVPLSVPLKQEHLLPVPI